jgi:hypothetical protein
MTLYVWDLETFSNCFLFNGKFDGAPQVETFEISPRRNDKDRLLGWLNYLSNAKATMVGFNSINFDYEILHDLLTNQYTFDEKRAYHLCQTIIKGQGFDRGQNNIRLSDRLLPQIDLLRIHHFDNRAKSTSLKALQFAMRSESLEDLPYDPSVDLTFEQMDHLVHYGIHDVFETEKFLQKSKPMIALRQELLESGVLSGDVLNFSDVKIGTEYLIRKLGRSKCFISGSNPRQTLRPAIAFKDIILPKISFRTEVFNAVLDWFKGQTIYPAGEARPRLETTLAGLQFHFGVGGVHASVENQAFFSSDTHVIKDIDVSGMYVAVAIANGFAPEHLGKDFTQAYRQLQSDRAQHAKGTTLNAVLKLAGNGVYGNSNNSYSCFYDPRYTFSVTVNGQLQLLALVESLSAIPECRIIQANTDGITVIFPRNTEPFFHLWKTDWELSTGLKLEEVEYSAIWIRDVNNYLALTKDGKIKAKGAYWYPKKEGDYDGWWNKDFSNMAAQKSIEACLIRGYLPRDVVRLLSDPFDFMLRYKTPSGAKLYVGDKEQLRTVRYYVSTEGEPMKKIANPKGELGDWKRKNKITNEEFARIRSEIPKGAWDERIHTKNKGKYTAVTTSVEQGWLVKACNRASDFRWSDVNYDYYIKEIEKLQIGNHGVS